MTNIISMFVGSLFFIIVGLNMFFSAVDSLIAGQKFDIIDLSGLVLVTLGIVALIMTRQTHQGYKEDKRRAAQKNIR